MPEKVAIVQKVINDLEKREIGSTHVHLEREVAVQNEVSNILNHLGGVLEMVKMGVYVDPQLTLENIDRIELALEAWLRAERLLQPKQHLADLADVENPTSPIERNAPNWLRLFIQARNMLSSTPE